MPYHKSGVSLIIPSLYSNYFKKIDSICQENPGAGHNDSLLQAFADEFATLPSPQEGGCVEDIKVLSKDFLISNIDAAFEEWESSPLLRGMDFDEFKEQILPYRTVDESLTDGKNKLKRLMYSKISGNGMDDIHKPIELYKKYVRHQKDMNKRVTTDTHIGIYDLFIPSFIMDCHNLAATTCNIFRACGIPVVYEFTTQWPDKDSRHFWCSSPDSTSIFHPYTPPYNNLGEDWNLNLKYVGKVYRMTFAAPKDTPYFLKDEQEVVPDIFEKPTMTDVTPNYHTCVDITLDMPPCRTNKLAYLSFFHTQGLNPIAWGTVDYRKKTVLYKNVPVDMLFFPTYMAEDGQLIEFSAPFMIRKNRESGEYQQEYIHCNHQVKQSMHLLRKYPNKPHLVSYRNKIKGALLLAANNLDGVYDTLYILKDAPQPYWQEYLTGNTKKYRFYKLQTKDLSPINIAEYEFLAERNSSHKSLMPSKLPIFDSLQIKRPENNKYVKIIGSPLRSGPLKYQAFDGNPDTYIESAWFGMDFGKPVCVKGLRLYPRNARNGIEPAQTYQLLYYDDGKWKEHSTVRSMYNYLDFDSVPGGTIYWLRNLDSGKEELPFFYKDGKQLFINHWVQ